MKPFSRLVLALLGVVALGIIGLVAPRAQVIDLAFAANPACTPSSSSFVGDGTNGTQAGISYQVLTFDTTGTCDWTVPEGVTSADVLVVGGGGGGGGFEWAGGGGAGGVLHGEDLALSDYVIDGKIPVAVGAGGTGGSNEKGANSQGVSGAQSSFGSAIASGGGGGAGSGFAQPDYVGKGSDGGSGGGSAEHGATTPTLLYAIDTPLRIEHGDEDYIAYRTGLGLSGTDAAKVFDDASKSIDRVVYRMQLEVDGEVRFAEVRFDPWTDSLDAFDLRVPDMVPTNRFVVQEVVSNMSVFSNMGPDVSDKSDGVTPGVGFTGYLELWPWNFGGAPDPEGGLGDSRGTGAFDFNDSPSVNTADHGSFQVHNVSTEGAEETVISWTLHRPGSLTDIGLGNRSGVDNTDWTLSGSDSLVDPASVSDWTFEILANNYHLDGGASTMTAPTGWTAYGNDGGVVETVASQAGSGGGGAGSAGAVVPSTSFQTYNAVRLDRVAGDGGAGQAFGITGQSVTYAGGGGGATVSTGSTCSSGGSGGGGDGGCSTAGADGTDGLGGGGGGGQGASGGDGGDGVVIVRYALNTGEPSITIGQPNNPLSGSVSVPVTINNVLTGNYQAFVSVPDGVGTLSVTSNDVVALYGYDGSNFTRSSGRELGFEGTLAEVQAALNTLRFTSNSDAPQAEITVDIAQAPTGDNFYYFPDNGHYYEFVTQDAEIAWNTARDSAAGRSLFGLEGYLATITSLEESTFIATQIVAPEIWIGASDEVGLVNAARAVRSTDDNPLPPFGSQRDTSNSPSEGQWHWVTGPEAGLQFWESGTTGNFGTQPKGSGGQSVGGEFSAWRTGEPNNRETLSNEAERVEHYAGANFNCPTVDDVVDCDPEANWNDFILEGSPKSFLVEYGGMEADEPNAITASSSALVVPGAPTAVSGLIGDSSFTFSWSAPAGSGSSVTNYEYSTDSGANWVSVGSAATSVVVNVDDLCADLDFEVRAFIGSQVGAASTPITVSGCNTITIVASGGAAEGSGWSSSAGIITATQDVSIDASAVLAKVSAGSITVEAARIVVNAPLNSSGNDLILDADSGAQQTVSGPGVRISADLTTTTGSLVVRGRGGNADAGSQYGIVVDPGVSLAAGSGAIELTGIGGNSAGSSNHGVFFDGNSGEGNGVSVATSGGAITVTGVGTGSGGTNHDGVRFDYVTMSSGSGEIVIDGGPDHGSTSSESLAFESGTTSLIGNGSQSGDVTLVGDHFWFGATGTSLTFETTGAVSIEPSSASFSSTFNWPATVSLDGVSALTLGKSGNTAGVRIGNALEAAGPVTVYSDAISVTAALESTGSSSRIVFEGAGANDLKGTVFMTSTGSITADEFLIRNIHQSSLASGGSVTVGTFAAVGGHRLSMANTSAITIGTVAGVDGISSYTEIVAVSTGTGDLTVAKPVGTSASSTGWRVQLRAGRTAAFGDTSGGEVKITHTPASEAFNAPNAGTWVLSGSAANSTGLSAIATSEIVSALPSVAGPGQVSVAYRAGPPVFSSATTMRFDDELTLVAVDPAGGEVTFSNVNIADPCSVTDGVLSPTGIGDCVVRATAAGGATADQTVTISKAPQSITFTSSVPSNVVSGTTYAPSASATSGLTVAFTITAGSPTVCTLSSGVVEFQTAGSCTIEATIADGQSAAANYLAATAVSQTIVAGKINQTITFSAIADRDFGDPSFTAGATVSSGRTVTYASPGSSASVCRVNSSTGVVDILDVGDCTITASSAGDASYAAAPDVTRTLSVRAVVPSKTSLTSASFGDERITVGFSAPESDGGATITGYRALATPTGGGSSVMQICAAASPCTVTGLTNGTEYEVTLAAINAAGIGVASDVSPAVTPATAPDSVSDLRTRPADQQLVVQWSIAQDFGGGSFTRYEVYLRESGQSWPGTATQNLTSETAETVTLTGLTNGQAYDVKVVTISSVNNTEIAGTNLAVAFGVPVTVPEAPTGFSVTALSATTALASWKAPADNGGTVVTAYSLTPGCTFDNPTDTFCTLTGLTPRSTLTVSVGATNFVGTGATTTAVVVMPAAPESDSGGSDSSDNSAADNSPAPVVTPPVAPGTLPREGQPARLPVGPGPAARPDVVTGPMQFPGGPSGPLTSPRGFVGGVPAPVRTTPSSDGGLDIAAGTMRLGLRPGALPGSDVSASAEGMRLAVPQGGSTAVSGGGLLPGSNLQVFLPGRGGPGGSELARLSVNAAGEFDGEIGFSRNLDQIPLPIGEQVLQAVGYDENGNQVVVELPVNIAQGSPAPEWNREAGGVPQVGFGEAVATSAGLPESVTITALPEVGQVNAVAGEWSFSVRVPDGGGSVEQAGSGANVRLIQDRSAVATGAGFEPGTRVDVWLFSDPTLLGSVTVGDDGEFSTEFYLDPRFATLGEHTLQLQGVGTDGFVKAVNLGVSIEEAFTSTADGAGALLWWALGVFVAIVIALVLFALRSRRNQQV